MPISFDESRRLTGANLYFDGPGAALEAIGADVPDAVVDEWRRGIAIAREQLGWMETAIFVRRHLSGVTLAFAAPLDQLYAATEVNEWALTRAGDDRARDHRVPQTIVETAQQEADPQLVKLLNAARLRDIPIHWDDEFFTAGEGHRSHQWPANQLPRVTELDDAYGRIPKAVVTGSNGKTTVTRALASILSADGRRVGYSSTDGIVVDGRVVEAGDFSGPMGLRAVMRNPMVDSAILETARGGLLRRGLATQDADVAIVTNVSADHFGEYGVHTLQDLADVKLLVHKSLRPGGTLIVNAGNAIVAERAAQLQDTRIAWFARTLAQAVSNGLPACGTDNGHLRLVTENGEFDLGETANMPISLGGRAQYNLENLAAAALAAHLLGVSAERIAQALATFGANKDDNVGRLQYWTVNGVHVLLDYAHNPEGLQLLLEVASQLRGPNRMGLLLEQAGNRLDKDIVELASVGASSLPAHVWIKEIGGDYLRGRSEGEVVGILHQALLGCGLLADQITVAPTIESLVKDTLSWAQTGDVLVLPVHEPDEREIAIEMLSTIAD